jgi:hypothetical protein
MNTSVLWVEWLGDKRATPKVMENLITTVSRTDNNDEAPHHFRFPSAGSKNR